MEIEIETTEKWTIADSLAEDGAVEFSYHSVWAFRGVWNQYHPTNPQLRAAVERQWNKLRPLKGNEWRDPEGDLVEFSVHNGEPRFRFNGDADWLNPHVYIGPACRACLDWFEKVRPLKENEWRDAFGYVAEFRIRDGVPEYRMIIPGEQWSKAEKFTAPGARCLEWFEKNRTLAKNEILTEDFGRVEMVGARNRGNFPCVDLGRATITLMLVTDVFGGASGPALKDREEQLERLQAYWLENYQWAEDEYLDRESGTVKRMADDEVREKDGRKFAVVLPTTPSEGLSGQQRARYERIRETQELNYVYSYEYRMGEFGVQYRDLDKPCDEPWENIPASGSTFVHDGARVWMKRKGIKL